MRYSVCAVIATLACLQVTPAPPFALLVGVGLGSIGVGVSSSAPAVIGGVASGAVAGSIAGGIGAAANRRRHALSHASRLAREIESEVVAKVAPRDGEEIAGPPKAPEGVPQHNVDDCWRDAFEADITITGPVGDNRVKIEGLPPTCMVLSTVLDGNAAGGPRPYPCGTTCLEYGDMTPEEYDNIRSTVNAEVIKA